MTIDPDRPCPHEDFQAVVGVARQQAVDGGPIVAFCAEIRVWCAQCEETFRFVGVEAGVMPNRPMCSPDESELRAPIRPASSDPDFGMGLPGFAVRFRDDLPLRSAASGALQLLDGLRAAAPADTELERVVRDLRDVLNMDANTNDPQGKENDGP